MAPKLEALEARRGELYEALAGLGDFRRGSISVNYRTCGKANCACARAAHPGHEPQYLWTATIGGKSRARNLRLGPEMEKMGQEVDTYRGFVRLCCNACNAVTQRYSQGSVKVAQRLMLARS